MLRELPKVTWVGSSCGRLEPKSLLSLFYKIAQRQLCYLGRFLSRAVTTSNRLYPSWGSLPLQSRTGGEWLGYPVT